MYAGLRFLNQLLKAQLFPLCNYISKHKVLIMDDIFRGTSQPRKCVSVSTCFYTCVNARVYTCVCGWTCIHKVSPCKRLIVVGSHSPALPGHEGDPGLRHPEAPQSMRAQGGPLLGKSRHPPRKGLRSAPGGHVFPCPPLVESSFSELFSTHLRLIPGNLREGVYELSLLGQFTKLFMLVTVFLFSMFHDQDGVLTSSLCYSFLSSCHWSARPSLGCWSSLTGFTPQSVSLERPLHHTPACPPATQVSPSSLHSPVHTTRTFTLSSKL